MEWPLTGPRRASALLGRFDERAVLDGLLEAIRGGESRSLVLRGEAGIGKTALLDYLVGGASDLTVVRAVGVESEMELAYASLHQLCAQLPDRFESLPAPQRDALRVAFGLTAGPSPDRFLVGLAVLSLMSEVAEERPLLCVVDDAQWLDQASALTLAFVARRLLAEPLGLVFAARDPGDALVHVPDLEVDGLGYGDAQALLGTSLPFILDERVRDRVVAETHGNPLAMLELPRGLTSTELTAGFGIVGMRPLPERIEQSFVRRLEALPGDARRLLLVAAAEPLGDPVLLWRAASQLGIDFGVAEAIETQGLLAIDERVTFRHPLVRSAIYRSLPLDDRRAVHRALAEATNRETDPDRRAWHLAAAVAGPDEDVAQELEQSAGRAQARGGFAAAAALLQRAVGLTEDPVRRADRALAAAHAHVLAGRLDAARGLLTAAEAETLNDYQRIRLQMLRAEVEFFATYAGDAPRLLLDVAQRLERVEVCLARDTYLDAWVAALLAGRLNQGPGIHEICVAARSAPHPEAGPRRADVLLDALACVVTEGRVTAESLLEEATAAFSDERCPPEDVLRWGWVAPVAMYLLWDDDSVEALFVKLFRALRDAGAFAQLPLILSTFGVFAARCGDFDGAAEAIAEIAAVTDATGNPVPPSAAMSLAALRGREDETTALIEATCAEATPLGQGIGVQLARLARAVLCNGLGRYQEAMVAAKDASDDTPELFVSAWATPEFLEAATRTGTADIAEIALERIVESTAIGRNDSALGILARSRALVSTGEAAESQYLESIDRLRRSRLRPDLARAHLLYGEWLRREKRRADSRAQLRAAYDQFSSIGMEAFAERARRELAATGETVRARSVETRDDLTQQERQIASMASEGLSNPEIGARLFLSPRTVEYHLRKVFGKLGIQSRHQLAGAMPASEPIPQ
ncbi:MAG TPA: AAA family ATPase [Solirubrobacteraceae bacterium]